MRYGIDFSSGPDYRKRTLNTGALDFNELHTMNIGSYADFNAGSSPFDGINLSTEIERKIRRYR